ncbi:hypothetical protein BABINDRAFT_37861 [Babjeviella inositovora NRRL Y-12698]|uniref:PUM-HD domain-containing protein n=1 Tax=Babjeviella inositovora NRRL Y-12698 TaxID=984486 RepID=A0A1E3QNJ6_9ASCO|nr:uncharacterized protein BABINDRAFT_37861 [Babjeviella inositovora NRRL Y-12698]ODQ79263.1 hypothetical protein BABINDRAFT_37861 [Babjeviella inositovora NRRL Y-12698]
MNVHRRQNSKRKGEDASKFVNAQLADFAGDLYLLCKDQHGCRFLQRQLDADDAVVALMIFNEIYLHIVELMTDPFGNYLIQKLFEKVSGAQRVILVKNAAPQFIRIALDPHGTRALQKLVECITTDEESAIVIAALATHIVSLSRDLNGNHVVQKCLQKLKPADNQFIFDAAATNCIEIATHRHGCCVLQRCLDNGSPEQCKQLSTVVAAHCLQLSLDPFGNYVVQYVLFKGDMESVATIVKAIRSDIVNLSLHKFGSNVIEKSLRSDNGFIPRQLIEELLEHKQDMSKMLHDAFGNYVLQTSLDVCNKEDFDKLSAILKPLLPNVRNTPHGRRISARIQNVLA